MPTLIFSRFFSIYVPPFLHRFPPLPNPARFCSFVSRFLFMIRFSCFILFLIFVPHFCFVPFLLYFRPFSPVFFSGALGQLLGPVALPRVSSGNADNAAAPPPPAPDAPPIAGHFSSRSINRNCNAVGGYDSLPLRWLQSGDRGPGYLRRRSSLTSTGELLVAVSRNVYGSVLQWVDYLC